MHFQKLLACTLSLILFSAWPLVGAAHTHLERSSPEKNVHLTSPPTAVDTWFSTKVAAEWSRIEVTDANGKRVDKGDLSQTDDPKHLRVELKTPLPAGQYDVKLNVISGDGHRVKSSFSFNID